jgi:hypothetical protein
MFSFRSISLVATLALATFSFAAPFENVDGLDLRGLTTSNQLSPRAAGIDQIIARGQVGVPDCFNTCHNTLLGLQAQIVVALKGNIQVEVVVGLLGQVVIAVQVLVGALKLLIGVDAGVYCLSGGIVVSLEVIAGIVCALLQLVLDILCLVITLSGHVEITNVVAEIVAVLLVVVQLTLQIVIGLGPLLIAIVGSLIIDINVLAVLHIEALLQICGLLDIIL